MSRCYGFPPPDYKLSDERIGIMMELIKLKKEKDERRQRRKERRKEKKREKMESQVERREDGEMEQSSVTEEHGSPVPTSSSSENTSKRKRQHCCTSQVMPELESLDVKHLVLPPPDLDWLYPNRNRDRDRSEEEKRQRYMSDSLKSCSTPHCAQYLHQIDAYALPYVVPF